MWPYLAQAESSGFRNTIDSLARTPLSQIVLVVLICTGIRLSLFKYLRNVPVHKRQSGYVWAKLANEAMDAVIYAGVFVFMIIRPFCVQAFLIPSGSMLQTLYEQDFIVANKAIYRYSEPQIGDIVVFKPPKIALNRGQDDVDFIKRLQGRPGDIVRVIDGKLNRNGTSIDEPYISDSMHNGDDRGSKEINFDWKLVHYLGKARPALYDQYIPVQMQRHASADAPKCNYMVTIAHQYSVGDDDPGDATVSYVQNWKSPSQLSAKEWDFARELEAAPPAAVPKGYVLMMGDNRNNSYDGRAWGLVRRDDVIGRSEIIWFPISRWRITR